MRKSRITVIGLCGRSVFMRVDHFHRSGETVHAESIYIEPGGKGYNQAVAAARLGGEVSFISCCGDDDDGKACTDFLVKEGITPCIQKTKKSGTAFATILTDSTGENQVTVYRGAADYLTTDFIEKNEKRIAESDVLLLNFEYPMEINETALKIAEKYHVKSILNPAPAIACNDRFLNRFFCITPNQREAEILGGRGLREIVTLGAEGCEIKDGEEAVKIPGIQVDTIDTTGAGDCFNGALAVAVGEGWTLYDAACFATKAAAQSVTRSFVMPSLPYRDEIQ